MKILNLLFKIKKNSISHLVAVLSMLHQRWFRYELFIFLFVCSYSQSFSSSSLSSSSISFSYLFTVMLLDLLEQFVCQIHFFSSEYLRRNWSSWNSSQSPLVFGKCRVRKADIVAREFRKSRGKRYLNHIRWIISWASREIFYGLIDRFSEV